MARLLLDALGRAGAAPELACRLRTYDRGDPTRQRRLDDLAARAAPLLARRRASAATDLWFTYHCHHKAPDGLGPRVSAALNLPYVVAEASIAPKRADGPWAEGFAQARRAIRAADVVLAMSAIDATGLAPEVTPPARILRLAPFTPVPRAPPPAPPAAAPRFVTVAMMRHGAKRRSYGVLAAALARLLDRPWTLEVIGDGPARGEIEAELRRTVGERVGFLGRIDERAARDAVVAGATALLWPAVDEAYGMALLEAQAVGVPVVAGDGHGVPDVVAAGESGLLAPVGDDAAFAAAVRVLRDDADRAAALGTAARRRVRARHSVEAATATLAEALALARDVHSARRR
ncbi:MAG: glycosyltransferase [Alphaproteobacteria bacterium]|nr:glycosyltransferase [Alphaproteobacteria bacterium]